MKTITAILLVLSLATPVLAGQTQTFTIIQPGKPMGWGEIKPDGETFIMTPGGETIFGDRRGNESTFYVVPPASLNRFDQDMRNYDRTINMNGLWDKD